MKIFMTVMCAVVLVSAVGVSSAIAELTVDEIRVQNMGGGPLDEQSVKAYISVRRGETFDRSAVNKDVRRLQETGRYTQVEVNVEQEDGRLALVYAVRPRRVIRKLTVTGADDLGNRKVLEVMELKAGDRVDEFLLGARAKRVEREYADRFFPDAEVSWEMMPLGDGQVDVTLRVSEGRRARLRRIHFIGNTEFSDRALRRKMKQKRFNPFNPIAWLSGAGKVEPDVLAADLERIRAAYREAGYLDVQVNTEPLRRLGKTRRALDVRVDEGLQYRVGNVRVEGITLFDPENVTGGMRLETYDLASSRSIAQAAQALRDYYGVRGYIQTQVKPELLANKTQSSVDIVLYVDEGRQAEVRDIEIRGNQVTQDKVIRRELVIYPGDIYNEVRVRRSENRLRNLGYFSVVNSYPEATPSDGLYDVVFEVEEQQMGQMSLGAGFSSVDELTGFFEISHGNFALGHWPPVGGGQKVKARMTLGTERKDYQLSFVEPWFLDRKLSLGIDLFSSEKRFLSDDYDQQNEGVKLSLSTALGRFNRLTAAYSFENIDVFNVSTNASERIRQEEGLRSKSALTLSMTRDTRDSFFKPTRGNRSSLAVTLAGGPLAGDTELYDMSLRTSQYWPLWWDHVLSLRARAGVVETHGDSERVPIFDRYFLGGAYTVRGFKYRDVGPVDEEEEPIGGQSMLYATLEYTLPLMENIRFATFYDTGMVREDAYDFGGDLNSSYGIGLRFDIPMMPLRFDYSWQLESDPHNESGSGRFSFVIGYVN